jgi:DNA-binding transcriptional MerR regulator
VSMYALLTIGEFSQLTHLSVKALRHYDAVGLLRPTEVDASTGYRRYATAQVPVAHVIRRFRDLDMPLEQIQAVLDAPDIAARDWAIVRHLERMEMMLEQTQATIASLRALLDGGEPDLPVEYRSVSATPALAIRDHVTWDDAERWLAVALDELGDLLREAPDRRRGPDAAMYSPEFFARHAGEVVAFVPVDDVAPAGGRVELIDIPAADLAVTLHRGSFGDLDRTYGALGTFVSEHVLAAEGPIREHYLAAEAVTVEAMSPGVEVCWPIRHVPAGR